MAEALERTLVLELTLAVREVFFGTTSGVLEETGSQTTAAPLSAEVLGEVAPLAEEVAGTATPRLQGQMSVLAETEETAGQVVEVAPQPLRMQLRRGPILVGPVEARTPGTRGGVAGVEHQPLPVEPLLVGAEQVSWETALMVLVRPRATEPTAEPEEPEVAAEAGLAESLQLAEQAEPDAS